MSEYECVCVCVYMCVCVVSTCATCAAAEIKEVILGRCCWLRGDSSVERFDIGFHCSGTSCVCVRERVCECVSECVSERVRESVSRKV